MRQCARVAMLTGVLAAIVGLPSLGAPPPQRALRPPSAQGDEYRLAPDMQSRDAQALADDRIGSALGRYQLGYANTPADIPAARWLPPSTLVPPTGAPLPRIVIGARGHALATWTDWSSESMYASYRSPGAPRWSKGVRLAFGAGSSDAALDPLGNAVVVSPAISASHNDGAMAQYRAATSGRWQRAVRLSPQGVLVNRAQVAMDDAGNAVAVWERRAENRVEASYRPVGTGVWQPPVTLWTAVYDFELSVAPDGSALVAAMVNLGPDNTGRYVRVVEAVTGTRGSWQPPERVAPEWMPRSSQLSLAAGSGGRGVVAWSDTIGGNEVVRAASHTALGWEQPESLSFPDGQASKPKVAIDGGGNMFAVWDATVDIEAASRSRPGAWTRPVAISAPMRSTYLSPSLSANAHGQALAAWDAATPDGQYQHLVQAALFEPDIGWHQATTLSSITEASGNRGFGAALDAAGDGLVYWDTWDQTSEPWAPRLAVQVAMLDAGGPLLHAPYPLKPPTISGVPKAGRALTCRSGRWSGDPPIAFSYQWQRGGSVVASKVRYLVRRTDIGAALRCRVAGSNVHGSATANSALVRVRR